MFSDINSRLALLGFLTTRPGKGTHVSFSARLFDAKLQRLLACVWYRKEVFSDKNEELERGGERGTTQRMTKDAGVVLVTDSSWEAQSRISHERQEPAKESHLICLVYLLSTTADAMAVYTCRAITSHHSFSLAVSTHMGDNFMNPLKCCSLLDFSTSCPKPLSFFTLGKSLEETPTCTF